MDDIERKLDRVIGLIRFLGDDADAEVPTIPKASSS
jgi:hypothetical protein